MKEVGGFYIIFLFFSAYVNYGNAGKAIYERLNVNNIGQYSGKHDNIQVNGVLSTVYLSPT
jgi:hypothetical protein